MVSRLLRLAPAVVLYLLLGSVTISPAATITLVDLGGTAPTNAVGGGTLLGIMQQAASEWASLYSDPFNLTIGFSWGEQTGSALASHQLLVQEGTPNRETVGAIVFDNDLSSLFFLDSTPWENSEFTTFTQSFADLGGGEMEVGRIWSGAVSAALDAYDLLSVARHEIGHALGLSSAHFGYQAESWPDNDIDVTGPLPYAGAAIPTNNSAVPAGPTTTNAHLNIATSLLWPFVSMSQRREITEVDAIANAQLSQFDLETPIPEPSTWMLVSAILLAVALPKRLYARKRSRQER